MANSAYYGVKMAVYGRELYFWYPHNRDTSFAIVARWGKIKIKKKFQKGAKFLNVFFGLG